MAVAGPTGTPYVGRCDGGTEKTMNSTVSRYLRLAAALGLPLVACADAPPAADDGAAGRGAPTDAAGGTPSPAEDLRPVFPAADAALGPRDLAVAPADATLGPQDLTIAPADATLSPPDFAVAPADAALGPHDLAGAPADAALGPRDLAVAAPDGAGPQDLAVAADGAGPPPPPDDDLLLPTALPLGHTETRAGAFTDDFLYGPEDYIKIGTRREWGGSIVYFGLVGAGPGLNGANSIDGNDTGREVQVALYDPDRIQQGCALGASCAAGPLPCPVSIRYLGWNPVQGGNRCNRGSGVEALDLQPNALTARVLPLHWNPDWAAADCGPDSCGGPDALNRGDLQYTQRLRFVDTHVVEIEMRIDNLSDMAHRATAQEFPTLYAAFGSAGTPDLFRLMRADGTEVAIDNPANDGFFEKTFDTAGGWATLQNATLDYGVGLYTEARLGQFQGWQRRGTFNNFRPVFVFGIPARMQVMARAYLILGALDTIRDKAAWLDGALPPFGALDAPLAGETVSGQLPVRGWALDNRGVDHVEVRLDGVLMAALPAQNERPDVCLVWPGYAGCPRVGFEGAADLAGVVPGPHTLEVVAVDTDGNARRLGQRPLRVE